jgi:hypothetical protein
MICVNPFDLRHLRAISKSRLQPISMVILPAV